MQALPPTMPRRRHCSCRYQAGTVGERGEKMMLPSYWERSESCIADVSWYQVLHVKTVIKADALCGETQVDISLSRLTLAWFRQHH